MTKAQSIRAIAAALMILAAAPTVALGRDDRTASLAQGSEVTVMTASLNVRDQPSLQGTPFGRLTGGTKVKPLGKSDDGAWWKIDYNGRDGYIFASLTAPGGVYVAKPAARAAAPAVSAKGRVGTFEVGGHIKSTNFLDGMRDAGMNWIKTQVVMDGGAPDMRGLIADVHGKGMKVLIGAIGNRGKASDAGYHKEFARNLADLASQGADAIEVWNEPNLDREYGYGKVDPANYANMLREAYGAIKSVNKNTLVVGGANSPTGFFGSTCTPAGCGDDYFLSKLNDYGAWQWMDCMGAHHNGSMIGPDQTNGAPVGSPAHYSWYFWGTLGVTYNAFKGRVPICWTELGYVTPEGAGPLPDNFGWGSGTTLAQHAQWLGRAVKLSKDSGKVRLLIVWNVDYRNMDPGDPQAAYSIFRPSGGCPACATIKAALGK